MPVTITSRFTPLTYDEIARPLIEQTRAQQELENAYMETSDKAAQIMAQANQQTDPIAYQKMKSYSDDLRKQADALMRNGLQGNSRRGLLDMRRRYNSDIVPIEAAVKRREELATEQRKLAATNPDLLFERDLSTTSLDDFVRNPQLTYGRTYSGNQIQQDVERAIQAVSQSMGSIQMGGTLGNGMREIIQRTGMAPEEVESMIRAGVDANTIFGNIAQRAIGKSGVSEWGNVEAMNRAKNYAMQGFYSGYGKVDRRAIEDYDQRRRDALNDYQSRLNMQYEAQQRAAAGLGGSSQGTDGNTWSEATSLRVKGTGEKVYVHRDENGNLVYSTRGEKGKGGYPHTVISADQVETKPSAPSRGGSGTSTPVLKTPRRITVGNTKGKNIGTVTNYSSMADITDNYTQIGYDQIANNPEWIKQVTTAIGNADLSNYRFYTYTKDASGLGTGDDTYIIIEPVLGKGVSEDNSNDNDF